MVEEEEVVAVSCVFVDVHVDVDVDEEAVLAVEDGSVMLKCVEINPLFSSGLIQKKNSMEYKKSNSYNWTTHVKLVTVSVECVFAGKC